MDARLPRLVVERLDADQELPEEAAYLVMAGGLTTQRALRT